MTSNIIDITEVCRVWLVPDSDTTFFCQLNCLISSDRLILFFRDATSFSPAARIMIDVDKDPLKKVNGLISYLGNANVISGGASWAFNQSFLRTGKEKEGCTSILPAALETEGMVECNYDATSKITGGWILRGHLGVALRGKHDRL
ncbi:hypothetical protein YC2023_049934 [Brassica napus]